MRSLPNVVFKGLEMNFELGDKVQSARERLGVNWANTVFLTVAHLAAVEPVLLPSGR